MNYTAHQARTSYLDKCESVFEALNQLNVLFTASTVLTTNPNHCKPVLHHSQPSKPASLYTGPLRMFFEGDVLTMNIREQP